jgi:hypothetical protein
MIHYWIDLSSQLSELTKEVPHTLFFLRFIRLKAIYLTIDIYLSDYFEEQFSLHGIESSITKVSMNENTYSFIISERESAGRASNI